MIILRSHEKGPMSGALITLGLDNTHTQKSY